ncbi:MAG: aspartate/glutamate racemase family protein [Candidatus Saccharibacteria bacterium]
MKIGVFDSGIGGEAVAAALRTLIPSAEIISVNDHDHVPYGSRQDSQIIDLTIAAVLPLVDMECDAIVIACNTATTVAIVSLRARFPHMRFVGLDPMIKPAARQTRTKHIAVLATEATLRSTRYSQLKSQWTTGITITEPDCTSWASLIEDGRSEMIDITPVMHQLEANNVDVIVLACTHFHWLKPRIEAASQHATILEPTDAIAQRLRDILN